MNRLLSLIALSFLTSCSWFGSTANQDPPQIAQATRTRYRAATDSEEFTRGRRLQTIKDTYDDAGQVVLSENMDASGDLQLRFLTTVANGLRVTTEWRRADDSLALTVQRKFDEQGREVEAKQYAPDGEFRRGFATRYTEDGRETGPTSDGGKPFTPDSFFVVNERGEDVRLRELSTATTPETVFTFDYPERDDYGNWTVKRTFRDGEPATIEVRELTYRSDD